MDTLADLVDIKHDVLNILGLLRRLMKEISSVERIPSTLMTPEGSVAQRYLPRTKSPLWAMKLLRNHWIASRWHALRG